MSRGEAWLWQRVAAWGWQPGINAALIALTQNDPAAGLDRAARGTILRHAALARPYVTLEADRDDSKQFWQTTLSDSERGRFRTFLKGEGYDVALTDLVINEAQAYLMHTANPLFFLAKAVGIPEDRIDLLRGLFLTGIAAGLVAQLHVGAAEAGLGSGLSHGIWPSMVVCRLGAFERAADLSGALMRRASEGFT